VNEINLPITPHHRTRTKLYTVQPYVHTHIPIIPHTGDNVAKVTISPEFPIDNTMHIYTQVLSHQNCGIIISNNKISHIIVVDLVPTTNATLITYELLCVTHTLHCLHTHYFNSELNMVIVIHCPNSNVSSAIKTHNPNPISPNQSLERYWDTINDLHTLISKFRKFVIVDESKQATMSHQTILQTLSSLVHHNKTDYYNMNKRTHPQLLVNNTVISNQHDRTIRTHSSEKEVKEYLMRKNNWTHDVINTIEWKSHGGAIQQLPSRQRKSVIQFIHNWLPTNTSHSLQFVHNARLCPLCNIHDETVEHFLSCDQPCINKLWQDLALKLKQKIQKYLPTSNHQLPKLIEYSLVHWRTTMIPTFPSFLHSRFLPLFNAQSLIGWNNMLKGRFSELWLKTISSDEKVARRWITYTIKHIWNVWYEVWKYRCNTNQGDNPSNKELKVRHRLLPQVKQLYDEIDNVDPSDSYIFKSTQEELLLRQPHDIERWVRIAKLRVKDSVARAKQRIKQSHLPIHQYFVHARTLLQKQKKHTKPHRPHNIRNKSQKIS
jgi:hypothetical protein